MDAFDADALIYAVTPGHALGARVRALFDVERPVGAPVGVGSLLLLPEVLIKPKRIDDAQQASSLAALFERLDLYPADQAVVRLATALGALHGLRTVDAVHLATAVQAGADRFITNNRRDFTKDISEIDVTYPDDLPEA